MGSLTTHVLDTVTGGPAGGVAIVVRRDGVVVAETRTNGEGRTDAPLLAGPAFVAGSYEIEFAIGPYFGHAGFLDRVPVRFGVTDADGRYHVPLVCTPWSYSTYRGS